MKIMQRIIYTGFAALTITSASMPVFPANLPESAVQGPDFEWYASVGRPHYPIVIENPPPRKGYVWSPGRWDWDGARHVWVTGHWVRDDYAEQVAIYNLGAPVVAVPADPAPPHTVFLERR